jgi:hypothetical protein
MESDEIWDGINTKVHGCIPGVSGLASKGWLNFLAWWAAFSPEIYDDTWGFVDDFLELWETDDIADFT